MLKRVILTLLFAIFLSAQMFSAIHSSEHSLDKSNEHSQLCKICLKSDNHQISFVESVSSSIDGFIFNIDLHIDDLSSSRFLNFPNIRGPPGHFS